MKIWIRDACTWTTDVGSESGVFSLDLLWLARTGHAAGTGPDAAPARFQPDPFSNVSPEGAPRPVNLQPDMRIPVTPAEFPQTVDLLGAKILRIRMEYCLIFAPPWTTLPGTDFEASAQAGWFEGLVIAPFGHSSAVLPDAGGVLGNPAFISHANMIDWLWWDRKYVNSSSIKRESVGAPLVSSALVYSEIDTRNGRRFDQVGTSLYWQWRPSGPPPPPATPQQGSTINGGTASWSVLLDVPQG